MPEASRCRSIRACQSQKATRDPGSAPRADSLTSRRTPARAAASMRLVSYSTCGGRLPQARNTTSIPSRAAWIDAGSAKSPTASSRSGPRAAAARAGSRTKARTGMPRAASSPTTADPTLPVAPVTSVVCICVLLVVQPVWRLGGMLAFMRKKLVGS
jgi:hypothetical protein